MGEFLHSFLALPGGDITRSSSTVLRTYARGVSPCRVGVGGWRDRAHRSTTHERDIAACTAHACACILDEVYAEEETSRVVSCGERARRRCVSSVGGPPAAAGRAASYISFAWPGLTHSHAVMATAASAPAPVPSCGCCNASKRLELLHKARQSEENARRKDAQRFTGKSLEDVAAFTMQRSAKASRTASTAERWRQASLP